MTLGYSDGSTATRAVDWTPPIWHSFPRPAFTRVHGTIRQPRYPAIFAYNRADPDIYRWEHDGRVRYLFTATDDTNNDNVGSGPPAASHRGHDRRSQRRTWRPRPRSRPAQSTDPPRRHGGRPGDRRMLLGAGNPRDRRQAVDPIRALLQQPTDDRSNEGGSWSTVQSHIIQLRDGGDPANPADWSKPMAIGNADGTLLGRPEMPANISLDMSYFELRGQGYYTMVAALHSDLRRDGRSVDVDRQGRPR